MKSSTEGQQSGNPLGDRVIPSAPTPKEWTPIPDKPGLEQNQKGQIRTNIPANGQARYIPC